MMKLAEFFLFCYLLKSEFSGYLSPQRPPSPSPSATQLSSGASKPT